MKYRYKSGGREVISKDFDNAVAVAGAIYGYIRLRLPYNLTIIGY